MSYVRKASTLCTCFLLLAACKSENEVGGGKTESIVAAIDLDAAGNIVRVDNKEDIFRFSYENGRLAQRNGDFSAETYIT